MSEHSTTRPRRRTLGRALVEVYYGVRQSEHTPAQVSLSIGLGTLIGCQPFYGLHLALCVAAARAFRLSIPIAYLAAHVNNPWTAPILLYAEAALGHRLTRGRWPGMDPTRFGESGGLALGRDLLVGSAIVGVVLGAILALLALWARRSFPQSEPRARLVNRISHRYRKLGLPTWEAVRAKARHDPAYLATLSRLALPEGSHLVDLGCGRGILLAGVRAAQELAAEGLWPGSWPAPPRQLRLTGIDVDPRAARTARLALGDGAAITIADLRHADIPTSELVVLLDVLHYLQRSHQDDLIGRVARALEPSGSVVIREADAAGGRRFLLTRIQERLSAWARLEMRREFFYRPADEWRRLLERWGFEVEVQPMAAGTPFSNVLIYGRLQV